MAKKRGTKRKSGGRSSKRANLPLQIVKILGGLGILITMVLCAGFFTGLFLNEPTSSRKSGAALRPAHRYAVPKAVPKAEPKAQAPSAPIPSPTSAPPAPKPVYEVFSKENPPAKPLIQLPPRLGNELPLVAIIIDDIGYDRQIAAQFMALEVPLTFSVLPQGTFNRSILAEARAKGLEIMLHLPMEPNEYPAVKPGPGALLADMSPDALIAQLNEDLDLFEGLKGVNNHMGSRISAAPEQLRQIFSILKKRGLYYIDSRTTAQTTAMASARLLQLPFAERDIFIDHIEEAAFIQAQLKRLVERARQQGYAVGIGHPHAVTYQQLSAFLPLLKQAVTLVPASMVVEQVMIAEEAKAQAAR